MDAGDDWRAQLQPSARVRIVNKITETLRKHLPVSVPEGLVEINKIAVRFEEKMYAVATSQTDYLRKIALKMLSMESRTNTQQNPGPGSSSKGKKQKKLRCRFCKKGGHFKKNCLKRKIWFEEKGVVYDPTHKPTVFFSWSPHENKNEGSHLKANNVSLTKDQSYCQNRPLLQPAKQSRRHCIEGIRTRIVIHVYVCMSVISTKRVYLCFSIWQRSFVYEKVGCTKF